MQAEQAHHSQVCNMTSWPSCTRPSMAHGVPVYFAPLPMVRPYAALCEGNATLDRQSYRFPRSMQASCRPIRQRHSSQALLRPCEPSREPCHKKIGFGVSRCCSTEKSVSDGSKSGRNTSSNTRGCIRRGNETRSPNVNDYFTPTVCRWAYTDTRL